MAAGAGAGAGAGARRLAAGARATRGCGVSTGSASTSAARFDRSNVRTRSSVSRAMRRRPSWCHASTAFTGAPGGRRPRRGRGAAGAQLLQAARHRSRTRSRRRRSQRCSGADAHGSGLRHATVWLSSGADRRRDGVAAKILHSRLPRATPKPALRRCDRKKVRRALRASATTSLERGRVCFQASLGGRARRGLSPSFIWTLSVRTRS